MQKGHQLEPFNPKMIQMSATVIKLFLMFQIILKILAKGEFLFDPNNSPALINHLFLPQIFH